jgi:hypothetical protein
MPQLQVLLPKLEHANRNHRRREDTDKQLDHV